MKVVLPCYAKFPQLEEIKENHLAITKGLQDPLKRSVSTDSISKYSPV